MDGEGRVRGGGKEFKNKRVNFKFMLGLSTLKTYHFFIKQMNKLPRRCIYTKWEFHKTYKATEEQKWNVNRVKSEVKEIENKKSAADEEKKLIMIICLMEIGFGVD